MRSVCEESIGRHRLGVNGSAPLHCEGSDSDPSSVARACTGRTAERFLGGSEGGGSVSWHLHGSVLFIYLFLLKEQEERGGR